jgi:hypothetical protein
MPKPLPVKIYCNVGWGLALPWVGEATAEVNTRCYRKVIVVLVVVVTASAKIR